MSSSIASTREDARQSASLRTQQRDKDHLDDDKPARPRQSHRNSTQQSEGQQTGSRSGSPRHHSPQSSQQPFSSHHRIVPTLFKNPTSRNSSQISLSIPQSSSGTTSPGPSTTNRRQQRPSHHVTSPSISEQPGNESVIPPATLKTTAHDAAWAQLTLKLNDIDHHASQPFLDQPMAELRLAQVDLAHAWRRTKETVEEPEQEQETGERSPTAAAAAKGILGEDEEKERELLLARKRREANDKHFDKAKKAINDVLVKLERTAQAMHKVEEATQEIWVRDRQQGPESEQKQEDDSSSLRST